VGAGTIAIPNAPVVLDAWGFTYKTNIIWDKQVSGMATTLASATSTRFSPHGTTLNRGGAQSAVSHIVAAREAQRETGRGIPLHRSHVPADA